MKTLLHAILSRSFLCFEAQINADNVAFSAGVVFCDPLKEPC
jgi:hypothetical protein